jgi:large subunit ribosomal protein L30
MAKKSSKKDAAGRIRVTLVRSIIGYDQKQRAVVKGLGLRRIGHSVEVLDHPAMRGMIQKVRHLVAVEQPAE